MSSLSSKENWFFQPRKTKNPIVRLYCFGHAGGNAQAYRGIAKHLPDRVECSILQLPGRAHRMREPGITQFSALRAALEDFFLDPEPFVFFGHSLGALIAFDLARHLRKKGRAMPQHLILSAKPAPHLPAKYSPIHQLPDAEFIEELNNRYQSIPKAIQNEPELLALFLPITRWDFTLLETWQYVEENPLDIPLSLFVGLSDSIVSKEDMEAWSRHTTKAVSFKSFPGRHFFIQSAQEEVSREIVRVIDEEVL